MKLEAYRQNISLSELKRLKSAGDGEERMSPLPHEDIIVSHESYETVSQQDAPPEAQKAASREATWPEAGSRESAAQEDREPAVTAPRVITVVPGAHEAALREATLQEAALREVAAPAPPVITVVPGAGEAAL